MQKNEDPVHTSLERVIGLPTAILLVAGLMIGSGAFKKIAPMTQSLMSEPYHTIGLDSSRYHHDFRRVYIFRTFQYDK